MKTIYKYQIPINENPFLLKTHRYCNFLHVDCQNNALCLWVELNPEDEMITIPIYIIGTGHSLPKDNLDYIGTALMSALSLVLHLYADPEKSSVM
jgi:hypothetical protein